MSKKAKKNTVFMTITAEEAEVLMKIAHLNVEVMSKILEMLNMMEDQLIMIQDSIDELMPPEYEEDESDDEEDAAVLIDLDALEKEMEEYFRNCEETPDHPEKEGAEEPAGSAPEENHIEESFKEVVKILSDIFNMLAEDE